MIMRIKITNFIVINQSKIMIQFNVKIVIKYVTKASLSIETLRASAHSRRTLKFKYNNMTYMTVPHHIA